MISTLSRYASNRVARLPDRRGVPRAVILLRPVKTTTFDFTYYQWQDGDRIDVIAQAYFDDERQWYIIANANPEVLVWSDVPVGTVIRIPNA